MKIYGPCKMWIGDPSATELLEIGDVKRLEMSLRATCATYRELAVRFDELTINVRAATESLLSFSRLAHLFRIRPVRTIDKASCLYWMVIDATNYFVQIMEEDPDRGLAFAWNNAVWRWKDDLNTYFNRWKP